MGLSNAASRARNYDLTINQNQGGGNKKAGFPYLIGRTAWNSIYLQANNYSTRCCKLSQLQFTVNPNVRQSRPTGSDSRVGYWHNAAHY
jgi:hypothetical protein